ncbi:histidine phosphatase family protein [Arcanobacterium hippocoleae]
MFGFNPRPADCANFLDLSGLEMRIDSRLRERSYGLWENKTAAEIQAGWPAEYQQWREGSSPENIGVERRSLVARRVIECVNEAAAQSCADDVILFVAHGGSIVNGVMGLLEMNPDEWTGLQGLDNCHWALLQPRPEQRPGWRIRSYNRINGDVDSLSHVWR